MNISSLNRKLMASAMLLGAWSAASAASGLWLDATYVEPASNVTLAFNLDNEQDFYGFQAAFRFPEGMEVNLANGKADVRLSSRADNSYTIVSNLTQAGVLRVGAFSATNTPFTEEEGALLYVNVSTSKGFKGGQLTVSDILFTDADNKDVALPDYKVTLRNASTNTFTIPPLAFNTGETGKVEAMLENEVPFTAFQFDLYLPEGLGVEADSWSLTSRASASHTLSVRSYDNGMTRFICFSPDSTPFSGEEGGLLEFGLTASEDIISETYTIKLRNLVFSAPDGRECLLGDSDTEVSVSRAGLIESINLEPAFWDTYEGGVITLQPDISPENAVTQLLVWSSSNDDIATVNSEGKVTANSIGTCVITATATDGSLVTGKCDVSVRPRIPVGDFQVDGIYYHLLSETDMTVFVTHPNRTPDEYSGAITIPETIDYNDFRYTVVSIGAEAFKDKTGLRTINLPNSLTSIGDEAFMGCTSLKSISIPKSVVTMGYSVFKDCIALMSVEIRGEIRYIDEDMFEDCECLTEIVLPSTLERINCQAFVEDAVYYPAMRLYSLAETPPMITGNYSYFYMASKLYRSATLYVPEESYEVYKSSDGWGRFSRIEPIKSEGLDDPENPVDPDDKTYIVLAVVSPEQGTVEYQYPLGYDARFSVKPASGWLVETVRFNGEEIAPDGENFYSTGQLNEDSELEIVYSQILTGTEEVGAEPRAVKVYCRDGEIRIDGLPANEPVTVCSDSGKLLYSGFSHRIPIDKSTAVIVVQTGTKAYKLAVR